MKSASFWSQVRNRLTERLLGDGTEAAGHQCACRLPLLLHRRVAPFACSGPALVMRERVDLGLEPIRRSRRPMSNGMPKRGRKLAIMPTLSPLVDSALPTRLRVDTQVVYQELDDVFETRPEAASPRRHVKDLGLRRLPAEISTRQSEAECTALGMHMHVGLRPRPATAIVEPDDRLAEPMQRDRHLRLIHRQPRPGGVPGAPVVDTQIEPWRSTHRERDDRPVAFVVVRGDRHSVSSRLGADRRRVSDRADQQVRYVVCELVRCLE